MQEAIVGAQKASALGEVPIGAVLVYEGEVIARGHNLREMDNNPTAHAEMIAIQDGAKYLDSWRLIDTTLYVTLEPCVMCMGGIILARIPRLVYGCRDPKVGAAGSIYNFATDDRFNHQVSVTEGVLGETCGSMLSDFFRELRKKKKALKQKTVE